MPLTWGSKGLFCDLPNLFRVPTPRRLAHLHSDPLVQQVSRTFNRHPRRQMPQLFFLAGDHSPSQERALFIAGEKAPSHSLDRWQRCVSR
jgi:hypothetical protein